MTAPREWPSLAISQRRISIDHNEVVFEGTFSRQEQIQIHSGGLSDRWVGWWSTPILDPEEIAKADVFFAALRGRKNTFYAYDPDRTTPGTEDGDSALWAGSTAEYAGATGTYAGAGFTAGGVTTNSHFTTVVNSHALGR